MDHKNIYLLLQIIKNNGNVKRLTREGLSFAQVADITNFALSNKLLFFENDILKLTSEGEELSMKLAEQNGVNRKEHWIVEEKKSKIDKIDKDFIYLPNKNELSFLE